MANPTTNYGFVLPTSSDLVTDLPADFDVALQGVDTRLKALNPETTLGDISYASATANTNTRLPIGTSGQVLSVSGGVPAWATPNAGGENWSLLNAGGTALTGATTITVSGISNRNKIFVIVSQASSANASAVFSLRFNADSGANYNVFGSYMILSTTYQPSNIEGLGDSGVTQIGFAKMSDNVNSSVSGGLLITGANNTGVKMFQGSAGGNANGSVNHQLRSTNGFYSSSSSISSVSILSNSGNFDAGTIFVYTSA